MGIKRTIKPFLLLMFIPLLELDMMIIRIMREPEKVRVFFNSNMCVMKFNKIIN